MRKDIKTFKKTKTAQKKTKKNYDDDEEEEEEEEKNLHLDKTNCSVYVFNVVCSACF